MLALLAFVTEWSVANGEVGILAQVKTLVVRMPAIMSRCGFGYSDDSFSKKFEQTNHSKVKGLILAQNERWRRGLGMQVE